MNNFLELPIMQQVLYTAVKLDKLTWDPNDFSAHPKYLNAVTLKTDSGSIKFIRGENLVDTYLEYTIDKVDIGTVKDFLPSITINGSIKIANNLGEALRICRGVIYEQTYKLDKSKHNNNPIDVICKTIDTLCTFSHEDARLDINEWSIDVDTILKLNRIFKELDNINNYQWDFFNTLMSDYIPTIGNKGTGHVYIELKHKTKEFKLSDGINFKVTPLEDDFDFYIQLHKDIKRHYATAPNFRAGLDLFDDWEDNMFCAIKNLTGKSPYKSTLTPECVYSNEIYNRKDN